MPLKSKISFRALVAAAALGAASPSFAAETFDVTTLPRPAATKDLYTGPSSAIYVTAASLTDAAAAIRKSLAAEGWQEYTAPFAEKANNPTLLMLTFKNGWRGLNVMIQPSPVEKNSTSVNYTPVPLEHELPFPKAAADIAYDPTRPYLSCRMPGTLPAAVDEFAADLAKLGYTRNTEKGDLSETAAHAFFLKSGIKKPMLLSLRTTKEGDLAAKLELVPLEIMTGSKETAATETPAPAPAPMPPQPTVPGVPSAETLGADIMREVQSTLGDLKLAGKPAPKAAEKSAAAAPVSDEPAIVAEAGSSAPIPIPAGASGLVHDAPSGTLTYSSTSSVTALAAFYRKAMREAGWTELPTVISRPNMSVVVFKKDGHEASITLMQMGSKTNVRAVGSALERKASTKPDSTASNSAPVVTEIERDEKDGLPVPKERTSVGLEKTLFRRELTATVPYNVVSVLAFYRRELTARGWSETPGREESSDRALVTYSSAAGPATLRLTQEGNRTEISFATRETAAAKTSGLMPQPGHTKILLGNVLDRGAEITVGTISIRVKAGAGANGPDGPTLEIGPGKYVVMFKADGIAPAKETIEVNGDEIWGLMLGPGGILPIQMY